MPHVSLQMDIAYLNFVSRPDDKPLVLTTVDHAAFSPDGLWLATVRNKFDVTTFIITYMYMNVVHNFR